MNVGHEEEELKPYTEPEPDFNDTKRIGNSFNLPVHCFLRSPSITYSISVLSDYKSDMIGANSYVLLESPEHLFYSKLFILHSLFIENMICISFLTAVVKTYLKYDLEW